MAERPRELDRLFYGVCYFEAKFQFWADQEVLYNYKANIAGNIDITL